MKQFINKIKTLFTTRPSNAFLLFITGFLFTLFMLTNVLHFNHPFGGWVTDMGLVTTSSIMYGLLFSLSLSLLALWRSANKNELAKKSLSPKSNIVKMGDNYSPIDYPKGSTQAVVSGYAVA